MVRLRRKAFASPSPGQTALTRNEIEKATPKVLASSDRPERPGIPDDVPNALNTVPTLFANTGWVMPSDQFNEFHSRYARA
jgi:hypothetical protein